MENNLIPTTDPEGTIPVTYAKELTSNWRTYLQTSQQEFATHAFVIPIVAFQNILKYNPTAEGVRAYIGLEDPSDPTTAKLCLVPIKDGNDVLYLTNPSKPTAKSAAKIESADVGDDDPSNVYDLTRPCPTECGDDNGLNG